MRQADLAADRRGDRADRLGLVVAQHLLERLQLVDAVDVELRLGEPVTGPARPSVLSESTLSLRLGAFTTQVPASRSPTRSRSLLNRGKNRKIAAQARPASDGPAADAALRRIEREEGERQIEFDLAHHVAGDDPVGGQPLAAARDHAEADGALAEGRRARPHLEQDEVEIAQQEEAEQPDDRRRPRRALHAERGDQRCRRGWSAAISDPEHDQRGRAGTRRPAGRRRRG